MMLPGVVTMFIGLEEPKFTTFSIDSVTVIKSSLYCSRHCQKSYDFSCNCCGSTHIQNLFKPVACINGCFNKYDQCSKKQQNQVELLDHEVKSARPYVAWGEDNLLHGLKSFHRSKKHWQTWCCMHSPFDWKAPLWGHCILTETRSHVTMNLRAVCIMIKREQNPWWWWKGKQQGRGK